MRSLRRFFLPSTRLQIALAAGVVGFAGITTTQLTGYPKQGPILCASVKRNHHKPHNFSREDLIFRRDYRDFDTEYEKLELIGEGGFAKVWKVRHKRTGLIRAAKVANLLSDSDFAIFTNEVEILRKLDSPYNVRMIEYYLPERSTPPPISEHEKEAMSGVIVYHLIQGRDLLDTINERISDKKKFSELELVSIARQVLKALCYVHKCGYIHRDIKPENFIVETEPDSGRLNIKLIDFGLSKPASQRALMDSKIGGTWFYAAPETLRDKYSSKSDAWSVGVILTTLVSYGSALIGRSTSMGTQGVKQASDPVFIQREMAKLEKKGVDRDAVSLIRKLLEPDPAKRISPEEALREPYLFRNFQDRYDQQDDIIQWSESFQHYQKLNTFAKLIRLYWVHQLNDSEFSRLRFLFRMLDRDAKGYINDADIRRELGQRSVDETLHVQVSFEEFIAIGLSVDQISESNIGLIFRWITDKSKIGIEDVSKIVHQATHGMSEDIIESCGSGFRLTYADFARCVRGPADSSN